MILHTCVLVLFTQQFAAVSAIHIVAFVGINRTDLAQSINSSATHLRSILKQTVTWTLYEYEEEQPSAHIQLFESVCTDLKNDSRPYPDILLDLSSDDEHSCFFGEIARQLDIGLMALNKPACVPFAVQSPFAKYSMVEIPAIRFPKSVPFNVLTAFSDVLFNANEAEIVYFTDKALGTQAVLGSSVSLKLSGRMNVHLQSPIDKNRLQKILTAMTQTIRVGAFVFIMDQPIMAELMDSEEILIIQQYPLSRNVIVFDTHANTSYCDVMCHVVDGVLVHCGAEYSAIQFYCIQIDMSEASASSLLNLQNGLNDIWSSMSTNQLDAAYTYDAVKTSVHTVASLIAEGQWGNHTAKDKSGLSGCTSSTRPLTNGTRFYKFAERLTHYPVSSGASGIINFTESFTNRKANFMLKFCDIFNELQGPTCRNMNASFSYEKQKLTVPEKLDLAQNRLELRVRIIPEDPFVIKTAGGYTGYCIELFEMIATSLGLPFVYVEQPDQNYGTVQTDGSWNGLIGSIAYREADVGLGRLIVSSEAEKVVDFTSPTMRPAGIVLLMSTEGDMDTTIDYFVEIFSIDVWLVYLAAAIVMGAVIWVVEKLWYYGYEPEETEEVFTGSTVGDSFWYSFSPLAQQGDAYDAQPLSVKMLLLGYWFFIYLFLSVYGANLEARMHSKSLRGQIDTVEEMLDQTDVPYTISLGSHSHRFVQKMSDVEESLYQLWKKSTLKSNAPTMYSVWKYPLTMRYQTTYKRMQKWGLLSSTTEVFDKLAAGWAIFMESTVAFYYLNTRCGLRQVDEQIGAWYYGMALPVNSLLRPKFNKIIAHLQANGSLDDLEGKWWPTAPVNCPEVASDTTIPAFASIFVYYAILAALAMFILQLERIIHKIMKGYEQERSSQNLNTGSLKSIWAYLVVTFGRKRRRNNKVNAQKASGPDESSQPTEQGDNAI